MSKIRFTEISEPTTPTTGKGLLYLNSDGKIKQKADDGTVYDLTASGVTDHGALTGLSDDDHTQYILTDGSRAFSGTFSGTSANFSSNLNAQTASFSTGLTVSGIPVDIQGIGSGSFDPYANENISGDWNFSSSLTVSGLPVVTGNTISTISGTAQEIEVTTAGTGVITLSLSDDPVLPGSGSLTVMSGTTAARSSSPTEGMLRYNSDGQEFEGYTDEGWSPIVDTNDPRLNPQNVKVVQKNPGPGQYSSVKDAVDSITDSSQYNTYVVLIHPGLYIENTITLPTGVHLLTMSPFPVFIIAANPSDDLIIMNSYSGLRGLTLTGCTGTGARAILVQDALATFAVDMNFSNNYIDVYIDGVNSYSQHIVVSSTFVSNSVRRYGVRVIDEGPGAQFVMTTSFYSDSSAVGTNLTRLLDINGANAYSSVSSSTFVGSGYGDGIVISNGGLFTTPGMTCRDFINNIHILNTGNGATLQATMSSINANSYDILCEDPDAQGYFIGAANRNNVSSNSDIAFSYSGPNASSAGFNIVGDLYLGSDHDSITKVTDLILRHSPFGLTSGGSLTISGGLNLNVASGTGFIEFIDSDRMEHVSWGNNTLTLPDNDTSFIYINSAGVPSHSISLTDPDSQASHEQILLGEITTISGNIGHVYEHPRNAHHLSSNLDNFLRQAVGPVYGTGSIVTENTTPLHLDVTSGKYYYSNLIFNLDGGNDISFLPVYNISGSLNISTISGSLIDTNNYDNGTSLTTMSGSHYTKHALWAAREVNQDSYFILYGQEQYALLADAKAASLPSAGSVFSNITLPIAGIIVQQGASAVVEISDFRPMLQLSSVAGSTGGGASVSDHGNLTGLLDDDHPQYSLVDGSRAFTGTVEGITPTSSFDLTTKEYVDGKEKAVIGAGSNTVVSGSNTITISNYFRAFQLYADNFNIPLNSDWVVNAFASLGTKTGNAAILVRAFDDTTEEGVGWTLTVPTNSTNITLKFKSSAATAPAGTRTVGLKLYRRILPDNSSIGSWNSGTNLTDISIPTNTNIQYDEQTLTLTSLSITAGNTYQFELTRVNPTAGTELSGDWYLTLMEVEFS